ncbi:RIP metalloprotease RseP [Roseibacillus ishigakijimensis]|uniref:Zinc metalloprotease n=1 Tax=Roseibacillus ishigakijimensis TaxID=454146 RepID=A0A934VMZ1_9BACT|nr:RIP metalloprotease RseP [Roseibacillus ishigakijimensis]MBK1834767.1 RIP metalloprotease RseP [Roseibacillus ishigakijimensis]
MDLLVNLLAIVVVVLLFNFMIFFHELGHFLAARWRGLEVEKFYIWFGKPIWKKTVNGVEYGLGTIPMGGYVALPQMAPMEVIEGGDSERRKQLPPISPLDKIIVAFAGPLFSFLLALFAACAVWVFGKPADTIHTTEIGYVQEGSPAEKAGLQPGDRILSIDGEKVNRFIGGLDGISEKIMLSKHNTVDIRFVRDGREMSTTAGFLVDDTSWFQRRAMRRIGVSYADSMEVAEVTEGSPAAVAGLQAGDRILAVAGKPVHSVPEMSDFLAEKVGEEVSLTLARGEEELVLTVPALVPQDKVTGKPHPDGRPMIGVRFQSSYDLSLVNPSPVDQVKEGLLLMLTTLQAITAKDSNVGIQHLSGPVGIGNAMFGFIRTDEALRRILWFMVVLNINLAIMNMLPLPVLDGGHIVLAIGEQIRGRPVQIRVLEIVQSGFVLVLLSLFLYITSKDVADLFPTGPKPQTWGEKGIVWPLQDAS